MPVDDDEIFGRGMASLGVEPLGGGERRRPAADREAIRDDSDRRLFEQAMRDLEADGEPAKADGSRLPRRPAPPKIRRLKARPKNLRIDDQIDLHGLRTGVALQRLESFVAEAAASGVRTVLVITGKGHHSPGGRGILRQKVEQWIKSSSWRRVRTWSQAPSRLGGRGAFVLYLRAWSD